MPSEYNPNLVASMEAKFRRLNNPAHAMADAIGMLQMFPGVVGIWPGSVFGGGSAGKSALVDVSGNALHLTRNGTTLTRYDGLASHVEYNGSDGYYAHADAAIFDILGTETHIGASLRGLTAGGWFRFSNIGIGEFLLTKWLSTGNQLSYNLSKTSGDLARVAVSVDGSTVTGVSSVSSISVGKWYFIAGRFDPSAELAIFLNGEKTINTTSIPASIFSGTADFRIGVDAAGLNFFDGFASLSFLSAAAVPDIFIDTYFQMTAPLFGVSV